MDMVLANASKATLLDQERTYLNTLTYRLYVNDFTPVAGMTALPIVGASRGDFTECTDSGYAAVTGVGFSMAFLNDADAAQIEADRLTWDLDHDGGDYTIYGYFVTDPANGHQVVFAQRDDEPFLVDGEGLTYSVVPLKIQDTYVAA